MSNRTARVAETLKEEISMMLEGEIKDPRVGFVTITGVDVSPDLRQGRVYYSTMGSAKDREQTLAGLKSAEGHIRTELGKRLHIKRIPELTFVFDESVESGARISRLLGQLREEQGD